MDDADKPVTRRELNTALEATKNELRDNIHASILAAKDDLREAIVDCETRLLTAFYQFAETNQIRQRQIEQNQNGFMDRVNSIEKRVTDLERRLNFPR